MPRWVSCEHLNYGTTKTPAEKHSNHIVSCNATGFRKILSFLKKANPVGFGGFIGFIVFFWTITA